MKFPNLTTRSFANKTIAAIVLLHFISLMLATRSDELWITEFAIRGTVVLYLILLPILWLWHRTTGRATKVEQLDDIREVFATGEQVYSYDPRKYFNQGKGVFAGLTEGALKPFYIPWSDYRSTHMQV